MVHRAHEVFEHVYWQEGWDRVPLLALHAKGRVLDVVFDEVGSRLDYAYKHGLWLSDHSSARRPNVAVDCEMSELVDVREYFAWETMVAASVDDVLAHEESLRALDGIRITNMLESIAHQPVPGDRVRHEKWLDWEQHTYRLSKEYVRVPPHDVME